MDFIPWLDSEDHVVNPTPFTNKRTGTSYATLQEAIDAAADGDTIEISPGYYSESVNVNKDNLTIHASPVYMDCGSYCFKVAADGFKIYGIDMYNASVEGAIYAPSAINNLTVKACNIHDNEVGINISDGQNNKVAFNNFEDNTKFGIFYGNTTNFDNATEYNSANIANGWYIDAEYNYWYAEKGPVFCKAQDTTDFTNCTDYNSTGVNWQVTNITQGDNVSGVDYKPWLRAEVYDYTYEDVSPGNAEEIDARSIADTNVTISVSSPTRVFIAGFWGNPGTDFVTNIGRFAGIEVNNTTAVNWMNTSIYYTTDDMYGKIENSSKMYAWNGKMDDYWIECTDTGLDMSLVPCTYTGYVWCNVTNSEDPQKDNLTDELMFGIGAYSDPVGGVALPADKIVVTSTYVVAGIVAALGIAVAVRRKE